MSAALDWLAHSPLLYLALTLGAYQIGQAAYKRTGGHPLAQPVVVAIVMVGAVLLLVHAKFADYRAGTDLISFWLGPATVALAVPLHRQVGRLHGYRVPILVAVPLGAFTSITVAVLTAQALGGGEQLARSLAPKAATTPVSVALSGSYGGSPSLTAVFTIIIGITGAVLGPKVLTLLRVRDPRARGLAMGAVSHAIGTSRSLRRSETEGAFAGLSMGLTALATSLLIPLGLLVTGTPHLAPRPATRHTPPTVRGRLDDVARHQADDTPRPGNGLSRSAQAAALSSLRLSRGVDLPAAGRCLVSSRSPRMVWLCWRRRGGKRG